MGLLEKLFLKNEREEIEDEEIPQMIEIKPKEELTIFQKYPDGLPLDVLELISFKKFGAMLKENNLLPPSYGKNPIKIEIDHRHGKPRVILTFKSKPSESLREVSIFGYSVASGKVNKEGLTILEVNCLMQEQWILFVEDLMFDWEHGNRFKHFDTPARVRIGKDLMQEDEDYIKSLNQIAKNHQESLERES